MTSGVLRQASDDLERQLEKQMGCMAGFLQIFDRNQFIPGRRIYGPKRINSFSTTGSTSPSERSDLSAREVLEMLPSSPENLPKKILAFDFREGMKNSWKLREAPRLSLDSRLRPRDVRTSPAKYSGADSDKNQRSPSVVARLMGLDALPSAANAAGLQRSASESRVSRDRHLFVEDPRANFAAASEICKQKPQINQSQSNAAQIRRRGYLDAQDFYPELNQIGSRCLYGEIEKKLIDDTARDVEALKQILEALQLKGLLHLNSSLSNLTSDHPIVVMKPFPKPVKSSQSVPVRSGPVRRNLVEEKRVPNRRSPRSPDPNPRRKPLSNQMNGGRISAFDSSPPKSSLRKMSSDRTINQRLSKDRMRSPAEDDAATANSESSSLFDHVRPRAGRSLLERCDKLRNTIAEFTSAEQITASVQQPSPVSILDSSFLTEESSPSPLNKRSLSLDFKDKLADWEDENLAGSRPDYVPESDYPGFAYVSNIIVASDCYLDSPSDVYYFLEKHCGAADASGEPMLNRRLIFDVVLEILDRKRCPSPWEAFSGRWCLLFDCEQLIREVWSEVTRSRDDLAAEDLNAAADGAIKRSLLCGDHWWGDTSAEMSDLVLNVERMVFKDLVMEVITDLTGLVGRRRIRNPILRRKLLF